MSTGEYQLTFYPIWARAEMTCEAALAWEGTLDDFARLGQVPTRRIGRLSGCACFASWGRSARTTMAARPI